MQINLPNPFSNNQPNRPQANVSTTTKVAKTIAKPFVIPYGYAVTVMVILLLIWNYMSGQYEAGNGAGNVKVAIYSSAVLAVTMLKPVYHVLVSMLGVVLAALNWRDPRKEIPNAIETYWKAIGWLVMLNAVFGLFLSDAPADGERAQHIFWVWKLALVGIGALGLSFAFGVKSNGIKLLVFTIILVFFLFQVVWGLVGKDGRDTLSGAVSTSASTVSGAVANATAPSAMPAAASVPTARFETSCSEVVIPSDGKRFHLQAGQTALVERLDREAHGWFQVGPLADVPLSTAASIGYNAACGADTVTARQDGWFVIAEGPNGGVSSDPTLAASMMDKVRSETRAVLRAEQALASAK